MMPNICGDCKAKVVAMGGGKDVAHSWRPPFVKQDTVEIPAAERPTY
jgi:hypothetical protein